jgi:hypothetical protein
MSALTDTRQFIVQSRRQFESAVLRSNDSVAALVDWAVRDLAPIWLEVVALHEHADTVRSLAPINAEVLLGQPAVMRRYTLLLLDFGTEAFRRTEQMGWTFPGVDQDAVAVGPDEDVQRWVGAAQELTVALGGCRGAVGGSAQLCIYASTLVPRDRRGHATWDTAWEASRASFARLVSCVLASDGRRVR